MNRQVPLLILSALIGFTNAARAEVPDKEAGATPFYVWQEELTQERGALLRQDRWKKNSSSKKHQEAVRILYTSRGGKISRLQFREKFCYPRVRHPKAVGLSLPGHTVRWALPIFARLLLRVVQLEIERITINGWPKGMPSYPRIMRD